jgi:hypothetical protein
MTVAKPKPCQEPDCERPKWAPKHRCYWHALLQLPIDEQIHHAEVRHKQARNTPGFKPRPRVPAEEWPAGERWCSGCQWFVPSFYTQGSRCKACGSKASYSSHLKSTYGITYDDYRQILEWQGGRCFICRKKPATKRLAVDHDHVTGQVRGLLCADGDRGCNHAVLGNITGLDMARRIVMYLERAPWTRIRAGEDMPAEVAEAGPVVQGRQIAPDSQLGDRRPGMVELMRAWAAGQDYDDRNNLVPYGQGVSTADPTRNAERPSEPSAGLDAEWDALEL